MHFLALRRKMYDKSSRELNQFLDIKLAARLTVSYDGENVLISCAFSWVLNIFRSQCSLKIQHAID